LLIKGDAELSPLNLGVDDAVGHELDAQRLVHWVEHFFLLDLPDIVEQMVANEVKKSSNVAKRSYLLV